MQELKVIHVDMDAFYASVEVLDNPQLKGKPVIVGGDPANRSVVSAASYEVRKFGVHSAMPMVTAIKLCPHAVVLPVRMHRYQEISHSIHEIFLRYTPIVEPISIDEAFLDVQGTPKDPITIGKSIKADIKNELHLTASVGIAPNKFLAKLASDLKKPDGFVVITEQNKQEILDPLPVKVIFGVGQVTGQKLESAGIRTIAQLRRTDVRIVATIVGNQAGELIELAHGRDNRTVEPPGDPKSISSENTFAKDIANKQILLDTLYEQVREVSRRLRDDKLESKTIHLKLRYGDFTTITRAHTLADSTAVTDTLWTAAKEIFTAWAKTSFRPIRLIGFCASNLVKTGHKQLMLFENPSQAKQKKLDAVIDAIENRFGKDAVRRNIHEK